MNIQPYLNFSGQCEEAFKLYEQVLGGKIIGIHRYANSPMAGQVGSEWADKVMHVTMQAGDQFLLGSDAPGPHFRQPQGFSVCLDCAEEAEAERIYEGLSPGGQIHMALAETFWAKRFAMFADRFGTPWMINVSKPM